MSDVERAARLLLVGPEDSGSAAEIAGRAAEACANLSTYLSRLLGETGVHMILQRSIITTSTRYPWLLPVAGDSRDAAISALRRAMEQQAPEAITEAFVELLSTVVGLLRRLIGDGLVERLLNEVWPAVFVPAVKDTP